MIPVLGIAYLNRSDLFAECILSIDFPVDELVIIDNSGDDTCPVVDGAHYIKMPRNMGVSWAWNTIIKAYPLAPWWLIANSDVKFGPGSLQKVFEAMKDSDLTLAPTMATFGLSHDCVETVGWFDEAAFIPAYCEDNDYLRRARRLGITPTWRIR